MLELLWVTDPAEVQNEKTRRTRLWDRCQGGNSQVNPFGIVFRPKGAPPAPPAPFRTWPYTPAYLPPGLAMQVADGTTLYEPELFYLPFLRRAAPRTEPVVHALPIRRIRGLSLGVRDPHGLSAASRCAQEHGLVSYFEAPQPLLQIWFEGPADTRIDLRSGLPLVFRSV